MARTWLFTVLTETSRSSAISPRLLSDTSWASTSLSRALNGVARGSCGRCPEGRQREAERVGGPGPAQLVDQQDPGPATGDGERPDQVQRLRAGERRLDGAPRGG